MPRIYVIGGPNGAGKTTASMALFPHGLQCPEYVNADAIAAGISPFRPESVALQAGRVMLPRLRELVESNQDFAFETTMASRSFAPFLRECMDNSVGESVLVATKDKDGTITVLEAETWQKICETT